MTSISIRRRLIASVIAIQALVAGLAISLVVEHERRQSLLTFDARLGEQAAVLRSLLEAPDGQDTKFIFHRELMNLRPQDRYAISDSNGVWIDGSLEQSTLARKRDGQRSIVALVDHSIRYRALILDQIVVVDTEPADGVRPKLTLVYAAPVDPMEHHIREVALEAVAICLAVLALSGLVSAWALARGLRPLRDLAQSAEGIDVSQWKLPDLATSRSYTELRPLADAMASLVGRLQAAFEREQQFFGDAAHEMKSSIAIVRSTLEYALQADRSAPEYRAELEAALADTGRLRDLVASMLQLARIESGGGLVATEDAPRTEINALIAQVVDRFRTLAQQREIRVVSMATPEEVWVAMSEDALLTVVSNLVENAIFYSDRGKQVTIHAAVDAGWVTVSVADQGYGIAEQMLPNIFKRFFRGDESRARATGGVGLGLSITKALVAKAGGSISVRSALGVGSTFTARLPQGVKLQVV